MEDDDIPPTSSGLFSSRIKFNPKKATQEFKAAAELVEKIKEENSTVADSEVMIAVTPPKKTRKRGNKKDQSKSLEDKNDSFSEVILSSASKRKLKKLREQQERELARIEAENQKILSSVDMNLDFSVEPVKEVVEEFEKIVVLTIMYMSQILRVKCYENDKFLEIFPKVAELLDLNVTEFLLCLKARNITVDDTPKSLNLTEQDVLECIPYKADLNSKTETEDNTNTFTISFQSNDTKKKIDMSVHKVEKMKDAMRRYSEQRDIPLERLIFDFDGERLTGEETPAELDMESESCIDVTVLVPTSNTPKKRGRKKK